jgi:DNA polymerase-3 subunit beta
VFTGVLLKYAANNLTIASTDGFRLSEKLINVPGPETEFTTILPSKTLLEVARIFSNATEPIKFLLNENENLALFKAEDTFVTTRVLDGQYPDYKRIIPSETSVKVVFPADEFIEAVKLTNIFAKEGNSAVKIRIDPEIGIKVTSLAGESGEHESLIPAEVEGSLVELAFSSKYLLDFLNNVKTEKIIFLANSNTTPCILKSEMHADFLHIIMPMQV